LEENKDKKKIFGVILLGHHYGIQTFMVKIKISIEALRFVMTPNNHENE